jgi:hypothetical protein
LIWFGVRAVILPTVLVGPLSLLSRKYTCKLFSAAGIALFCGVATPNPAGPKFEPKIEMSSPGAMAPLARLAAFTIPPAEMAGATVGGVP